ncbi:ABC transporter permease subunit [Psychrosphaera sp. B3R10]|uniref:ABC transporter permease n=1 Tax=unclassified Psychrosphaera TaxID=2641570 RepID=UPI001C09CA94|nr:MULTISPECIES: ABC transporter permease subunit [unclassified Psychrosphaera]MBU2881208.1 ABC transporter permease subunit [Psychrosphaera sp. I2R16]MBU2988313.1 ABC transporter permease subunit [Psychrosphaera sp. B3R10]
MIFSLFKKEFKDSVRDKRAVFAAMAGALFSPIFFAGMMTFMLDKARSVDDLYVEIVNEAQAPHIVELLNQRQIFHAVPPEQGKTFELDGESVEHSKITIEFDEDFATRLELGKTAEIKLTADYSKKETNDRVRRIQRVIQGYQSQLVGMKLMSRGISPDILNAIHVEENDTSSPSSKSALLLGMLGIMILVAVFVSSTNTAIDSSAGERERNSLELLLMQPVTTLQVVAAKTLNTGLFGVAGGTLSVGLTALVIPFIPLHKLGMAFHFDAGLAFTIWLLLLPLAFFAAAFQLLTAFHAKSFKEAQSYIQYTIIIPVVVPMALEFSNYKHMALSYVPIVAQQQAISQMIRGELESYLPFIGGSIVTVIATVLIVLFIARSLKSEKVVLGL